MWLTLLAVAVGAIAGVVSGGSVLSLGKARPIAGVLAIVWLGLTATTRWVEVQHAHALFVAANVAALAFCLFNIKRLGTPILLCGIALNTAVIAINGAMPYRVSAVISAGLATAESDFPSTVQSRPERPGDALTVLSDLIPVKAGPIHDVLSAGDLLAAVGVAYVVYRTMCRTPVPAPSHTRRASAKQHAHGSRPRRDVAAPPALIDITTPLPGRSIQPASKLVNKSTIRLGEEFDLIDDDAEPSPVVIELAHRDTVDEQPGSPSGSQTGSATQVGDANIDPIIDITDGDLPGSLFWAERTKQLARNSRPNQTTNEQSES